MKNTFLVLLFSLGSSQFAAAREYVKQNVQITLTHNSAADGSQQLSTLKGALVFSDDYQFCKVTLKQGDSFLCDASTGSSRSQNMWVLWIYVNKSDVVRLLSSLGMNQSDSDQFKESDLLLHHEYGDGLHHVTDAILTTQLNPADVSQGYSFGVRQ